MSEATSNTSSLIHESINEEYEYIQYNKQLRLIRSIDDDMYQINSIIKACNSNKRANDISDITKTLIKEIKILLNYWMK